MQCFGKKQIKVGNIISHKHFDADFEFKSFRGGNIDLKDNLIFFLKFKTSYPKQLTCLQGGYKQST